MHFLNEDNTGSEKLFPSKEEFRAKWHEFNEKYFGNRLQEPRFDLSQDVTNFGEFEYYPVLSYDSATIKHLSGMTIRLSRRYFFTPHQWQEVLIHEMVHQYVAQVLKKVLKDPHGESFMNIANKLNNFGWHIQATGGAIYDDTGVRGASGLANGQNGNEEDEDNSKTFILIMQGGKYPYFGLFCNEVTMNKIESQYGADENYLLNWYKSNDRTACHAPKSYTLNGLGADSYEECISKLQSIAGGKFSMTPYGNQREKQFTNTDEKSEQIFNIVSQVGTINSIEMTQRYLYYLFGVQPNDKYNDSVLNNFSITDKGQSYLITFNLAYTDFDGKQIPGADNCKINIDKNNSSIMNKIARTLYNGYFDGDKSISNIIKQNI